MKGLPGKRFSVQLLFARDGHELLLVVHVKEGLGRCAGLCLLVSSPKTNSPLDRATPSVGKPACFSECFNSNSCKVCPSLARKMRPFPSESVPQRIKSSGIFRAIYISRCHFPLHLSFLLLNENRTVEHHPFFLFFNSCLLAFMDS